MSQVCNHYNGEPASHGPNDICCRCQHRKAEHLSTSWLREEAEREARLETDLTAVEMACLGDSLHEFGLRVLARVEQEMAEIQESCREDDPPPFDYQFSALTRRLAALKEER